MCCAVMGQHPLRFPWGFDEEDDRCRKLKMELAQQIMVLCQEGVSQFLVACDYGVGLYAAEIVNGLRTTDHDLMLLCYTPHEEQATKWAPYLRERYFTMLEKCTLISAVCEVGAPDTQLQAYPAAVGSSAAIHTDGATGSGFLPKAPGTGPIAQKHTGCWRTAASHSADGGQAGVLLHGPERRTAGVQEAAGGDIHRAGDPAAGASYRKRA